MTCNILVGGAWGDEGKGKCITYLCNNDKPDIIARAGVGPNAGHSVEFNGEKYEAFYNTFKENSLRNIGVSYYCADTYRSVIYDKGGRN